MKGLIEIIGDGLIIAFGVIQIYIFLTIEVFGIYGVEANRPIRVIELLFGIPIVVLGVRLLIGDMKKR